MSKDMLGIAVRKLVTLPSNVLGLVCDLLGKLADPEWIEATKKFLRKENPWGFKFNPWSTLTIGSVSKDELLARLTDGFFASGWANDIMSQPGFTTLSESKEITLARAKVKDLGFTEPPTTTQLFTRIKKIGDLCPSEVGPHLRLADKDQPRNTGYWIAMEPITDSYGTPGVFYVDRLGGGERWLHAHYARPSDQWVLEFELVFCLRK